MILIGGERKGKRYLVEILSADEVRALLGVCTKGDLGIRSRCLILLMARCGVRVGSLVTLRPCDYGGDFLRVLKAKGGQSYTVGVEPECAAAIDAWLAVRASRGIGPRVPIACDLRGSALSAGAVRSLVRRLAAKAGSGKRVTPHTFRSHFAATLARQLPLPLVSEALNHGSVQTTQSYLSGLMGESVDAVRSVNWG